MGQFHNVPTFLQFAHLTVCLVVWLLASQPLAQAAGAERAGTATSHSSGRSSSVGASPSQDGQRGGCKRADRQANKKIRHCLYGQFFLQWAEQFQWDTEKFYLAHKRKLLRKVDTRQFKQCFNPKESPEKRQAFTLESLERWVSEQRALEAWVQEEPTEVLPLLHAGDEPGENEPEESEADAEEERQELEQVPDQVPDQVQDEITQKASFSPLGQALQAQARNPRNQQGLQQQSPGLVSGPLLQRRPHKTKETKNPTTVVNKKTFLRKKMRNILLRQTVSGLLFAAAEHYRPIIFRVLAKRLHYYGWCLVWGAPDVPHGSSRWSKWAQRQRKFHVYSPREEHFVEFAQLHSKKVTRSLLGLLLGLDLGLTLSSR